jgi:hypothetical protein
MIPNRHLKGAVMSKVSRTLVVLAASVVLSSAVFAQMPPQPGPEHARLKELEGTWDTVMKMGPNESKGTAIYKMDLGGLWLASEFHGEVNGQKFTGKGLDGYEPNAKKYVSVWVDSMSTSPMLSEGTYSPDGKVLTMTGEGPGPDGKPTTYKMTTEHKDKDTMLFSMHAPGPDGKEAVMFTISYTRRK